MKTPSNDGGAAFPVVDGYHKDGRHRGGESGMTLRDYFAGQALSGWLASFTGDDTPERKRIGVFCYQMADAMLAARERKEDAP
jgi:hypothetical protein